ncbi:hypothetical protein M2101_000170 [Parabacteroides sp. PM5-20]|nr:hypothetical protein [Parabacteroides sp. PM5-20]
MKKPDVFDTRLFYWFTDILYTKTSSLLQEVFYLCSENR